MIWAMVIALGTSLLSQPVLIRLLDRFALLDVPNGRSSHAVPTPRGGGVGVLFGIATGVIFGVPVYTDMVILMGVLLCAALGFVEDVHGVPVRYRLAMQAVAGGLVVTLLVPESPVAGMTSLAVVVVCAVGYVATVNAVNFMDGINGISTAQAVVGGLAYAVIGQVSGVHSLLLVGIVTASAMVAFAPFNFPHARVFLGDSGSYGMGAALAGLAVLALLSGLPVEAAFGPLAIYLADTGTTILRRAANGEVWYRPHREHVYQRLIVAGYSHAQVTAAVGLLIGTTSALGAVSVLGGGPERLLADVAIVAVLAGYLASPALLPSRKVVLS